MFIEGKVQSSEAVRSELQPYTASQVEAAAYIGDMAVQLQAIAHKSGLTVLAYVLSMAVMRAREIETGSPTILKSPETSNMVG